MPTETKTETKTAAPAATMFAGFDPMTAWTTGQAAFHQMMTDAMARFASFSEDVAALEHQMVTRAQGAVASWAQLSQDAIAYGAQLSAQARKLGLETARKFQAS
ncbi:MAG TPA: hypothetical protein VGG74_21515 [Kofleriaceae bacterium]|jgi:hypothetical protein